MRVQIGIVPNDKNASMIHLRRSSVIVSAAKVKSDKYARAVLASPESCCGFMRFPMVGACVVWGSDEADIIKIMTDVKYGWYVLFLKEKASGKLKAAISKIKKVSSVNTFVVEQGCPVSAIYLSPGQGILEVEDILAPVGAPTLPNVPKAVKAVASSKPAPKDIEGGPAVKAVEKKSPKVKEPAPPKKEVASDNSEKSTVK